MLDKIEEKLRGLKERKEKISGFLIEGLSDFEGLVEWEIENEKKDAYDARVNVVVIKTKTSSVKVFVKKKKIDLEKGFLEKFGEKILFKVI